MIDHLDQLESQSIYIIREAYKQFKDVALLWSIGKDSTTLVHLVRKAFYGNVPFPALHIDTSYKFKEIYVFRDINVQCKIVCATQVYFNSIKQCCSTIPAPQDDQPVFLTW